MRLRLLVVSDAELTLKWRLSPRARLLHVGAQTISEQEEWIQSRPENELNFIIETIKGEPCGMISLVKIDLVNLLAEPARFLVDQNFSKKPIAVEATLILYKVAFEILGLQKLHGQIVGPNKRMLAWQQHYGMVIEDRLNQQMEKSADREDYCLVSLSRTDYLSITVPRMERFLKDYAASSWGSDDGEI
ncbi:MAG: GNAT family N-acetyltransferase [Candidatus Nanopelagicaceae bacterium]|nr:GNAT family N-acetyltransferase [Candidatus Nanopelagicaceae bacterium]